MPNPQPLSSLLRGQLRQNVDIARNTWFQVGGPADWLFKPVDAEDLAAFMRALRTPLPLAGGNPHTPFPENHIFPLPTSPASGGGVPLMILGVGSNLLIRDGGVEGVVIRLGRGFTGMQITNHESRITIAAAALDLHIAHFARDHGIAGLEFLSGIPGTLGGAVAMNAGAYGREIKDVLRSADIVDAAGNLRTLTNAELGFSYRKSALPEGAVVVGAVLQGEPGDPEVISARIKEIQAARESTQPVRTRTGGSTFKNPPGHKAWELIDAAGCRGLQRGGAMVSQLHCNFLINTGTATAADLEGLGEEVRERVRDHCGVELEWEIRRVGRV